MGTQRERITIALTLITLFLLTVCCPAATNVSGNITTDTTWTLAGSPYILTGDVTVTDRATLTISPGVVVKGRFAALCISTSGHLVANGTPALPITFTSDSSAPGDWGGIAFEGLGYGGDSSLVYCVVEKGGLGRNGRRFNLYVDSFSGMMISHCTFRNSAGDGVVLSGYCPSLDTCTVTGNAGSGIYLSSASPALSACTIAWNGGYGIYADSPGCCPIISGGTIRDNGMNPMRVGLNTSVSDDTSISGLGCIEYYGGQTDEISRTWRNHGIPYRVLGDISVQDQAVLTIAAGVTVRVRNAELYVHHNGDLVAEGTEQSPITFTSDSGLPGGWKGITSYNQSDFPTTSSLRYCIVEKAGEDWWGSRFNLYTFYCRGFSISHCTFRESAGSGVGVEGGLDLTSCIISGNAEHGLVLPGCPLAITDCTISDNGGYGIYTNAFECRPTVSGCTIAGNALNPLRAGSSSIISADTTISGPGCIEFLGWWWDDGIPSRTWHNYGVPYRVLDDISVTYGVVLTIAAGVTVRMLDSALEVAADGRLVADGTPTMPIVFTSDNGLSGGWTGIRFSGVQGNDPLPSSLEYCIIEKGGGDDQPMLYGSSGSKVSLSHCTVTKAAKTGVGVDDSNWTVADCIAALNGGYGVQAVNCTPAVTHSDSWGNTGINWSGFSPGTGCIQQNPKFASSVDYHLQERSPCRGTGSGGSDMGAYLYTGPPAPDRFDIAHVKTLPDGTEVELPSKMVTAGTENYGDCAYIEEVSRCSGLMVCRNVPFTAWQDEIISVTGVLRTAGCERYLDALTVSHVTSGDPIKPLWMVGRTIGGHTLLSDVDPGAHAGLSNIGLLVRTAGTVTHVSSNGDYFVIDDGSRRVGADGSRGIRISCANLALGNAIIPPVEGSRVVITGVSTIEKIGGLTYSIIRPRSQNDVVCP